MGDPNRGKEWLGGEIPRLAHRTRMAYAPDGRAADNRLSRFYEPFPDCRNTPTPVLYELEPAIREFAYRVFYRYAASRGFPVVCPEPLLWSQELPQGQDLVAQGVVGASTSKILGLVNTDGNLYILGTNCDIDNKKVPETQSVGAVAIIPTLESRYKPQMNKLQDTRHRYGRGLL